jgi:hypothetical protein
MTVPNFAFSGAKQGGKDSAAMAVAELTGVHQRRAFADKIKANMVVANPVIDSSGNRLSEYLEVGRTIEEMKEDPALLVREWLQDHGQDMRKVNENHWVEEVTNEVDAADPDDKWCVTDMRFPNESAQLSKRKFVRVYVRNEKAEKAVWDAAVVKRELAISEGKADALTPVEDFIPASELYFGKLNEEHVIDNNGTIEEFRSRVAALVRSYALI